MTMIPESKYHLSVPRVIEFSDLNLKIHLIQVIS